MNRELTEEGAFNALHNERLYQDAIGETADNTPEQWMALLSLRLGKAQLALSLRDDKQGAMDELVALGAMVVNCLEQHGAGYSAEIVRRVLEPEISDVFGVHRPNVEKRVYQLKHKPRIEYVRRLK